MNEMEMEIGRNFGASAFYIYQTIKHNPKVSLKELEVETGMTDRQIKVHLKNLFECKIITKETAMVKRCYGYRYSSNEQKEQWILQ